MNKGDRALAFIWDKCSPVRSLTTPVSLRTRSFNEIIELLKKHFPPPHQSLFEDLYFTNKINRLVRTLLLILQSSTICHGTWKYTGNAMEASYLLETRKNFCECLLTTPTLIRSTVQEKSIVNKTSILSSHSHHGWRVFLLSGLPNTGNAQCGKTTGLNLRSANPHCSIHLHKVFMHTCVHTHVLCAFKAINQRSNNI